MDRTHSELRSARNGSLLHERQSVPAVCYVAEETDKNRHFAAAGTGTFNTIIESF